MGGCGQPDVDGGYSVTEECALSSVFGEGAGEVGEAPRVVGFCGAVDAYFGFVWIDLWAVLYFSGSINCWWEWKCCTEREGAELAGGSLP